MTPWHRYWLIWFLVSFFAFLGPEVYALCTNWRNTLSAAVWSLEKFRTGQPVVQWSAGHFLFTGAFALTFLWLLGHFGWGMWR